MINHQKALIHTFIPNWPQTSASEKNMILEACITSVFAHLKRAPIHVRVGLKIFHVFSLYVLTLFPLSLREQAFLKLSQYCAPFGLYTRLLRSLTALYFMEHPLIKQKLEKMIS